MQAVFYQGVIGIHKRDLTDQVFGKLTVLEMLQKYKATPSSKPRTHCRCLCKCGNEVILSADKLGKRVVSCPECAKEARGIKRRKDSLIGRKFGHLTVLEMMYRHKVAPMSRPRTYCKCKCDCGNESIILMENLYRPNASCLQCGHKRTGAHKRTNNPGEKYGHLTIIDIMYDSYPTMALCHCDCGNDCLVPKGQIIYGSTRSCGCRHPLSRGAEIIESVLKEHKIDFVREQKIPECRDVYALPFDFAYVNEFSQLKCIEYDGEQHFKVVEFFGGEKAFEKTRQHNAIKNEQCKSHNIPLLRIPYTDSEEKIREQVLAFL